MADILCLETATNVCSVALARDGEVIGLKETSIPNAHSKILANFMQDVLKEARLESSDLDAVAVSKGPGSYTGLRIGVSSAKGLTYGLDIPLISIPTLLSMAALAVEMGHSSTLLCPMIDARRMEVYTALFNDKLEEIEGVSAKIIDQDSFSSYLNYSPVLFFGNGAEKCKDTIQHSHATFDGSIQPSAKAMAGIAMQKFQAGEFEDKAYFEPFYLKDFVAGKPRVKGLFD